MSEQIDTAIRWAEEQLRDFSDSPRLDAELLLAHCLGQPRSYLYTWPDRILADACLRDYRQLIRRRMEPTPVAYLLGRREFYSLDFAVSPAVLVPRPETELLVETALGLIPARGPWQVCDLGTGSGVVAITIARHRPHCRVIASDIDPACLAIAAQNAQRHEVEVEFVESDWYQGIAAHASLARFDLIVSNPPYIAGNHPFLALGDLPAEPPHALSPGDSGREALEAIIASAPEFLLPGGWLLVEHGYDQQVAVAGLFSAAGFERVECRNDHNNLPRVSMGRLGGAGRGELPLIKNG